MSRNSILTLAMTTLLAASPVPAGADLTELVKRIQPSVGTIITYDEDEEVSGLGTGFFIDQEGHLVTNCHVLEGAHRAEVKTLDGKVYSVKSVVAACQDTELVKVATDIPDKTVKFVQLARAVPQAGEDIVVVGSPMGLEQTVTKGIVSAVREMPSVGKIIQLDAPVSPGSSGSPVVNMKGEVVGVATLQLLKGQDLNFAVCAEQILTLTSLPEARTLAEWTLDIPPVELKPDAVADIDVGEIEIPDAVRIAYAEYETAKMKIEAIENSLDLALKTYQPTSKTVSAIRERLRQARADLDDAVENKRPADETMLELLEAQIQAKQSAYEELIKKSLPSTPQAQNLQREIDALRQRQVPLRFLLGGNPGDVITNSIGMKLVWIPPGEFMMGSGDGESDEKPVHKVQISKGFWMGMYEVTNGQYQQFLKESSYDGSKEADSDYLNHFRDNSNMPTDSDYPICWVSWKNAVAFCDWLGRKEDRSYRLPTEAEWEYACRAGTDTRYGFSDSETSLGRYAWYMSNSGCKTHPVGQKEPNAFGLYDMYGNVWEWCQDWYDKRYYSSSPVVDPQGPSTGSLRALRGGSCSSNAGYCRSAFRNGVTPDVTYKNYGFRIVSLDF